MLNKIRKNPTLQFLLSFVLVAGGSIYFSDHKRVASHNFYQEHTSARLNLEKSCLQNLFTKNLLSKKILITFNRSTSRKENLQIENAKTRYIYLIQKQVFYFIKDWLFDANILNTQKNNLIQLAAS